MVTVSLEGLWEDPSCLFQLLWLQVPLACGRVPPTSAPIFTRPFSVCFSLLLSRIRNLSLDSTPDQAIWADLMRLSLIMSAEMPFLNKVTATGSED